MNEREINRLRKKVIVTSFLSFFFVMLLTCGLIYCFSTAAVRSEAALTMDYIIDNHGDLPAPLHSDRSRGSLADMPIDGSFREQMAWYLNDYFSGRGFAGTADYLGSIRYFAVLFDSQGNPGEIKTNLMATVDPERARILAELAKERFLSFGSFGHYFYEVAGYDDGSSIVVYLDRSSQIAINRRVMMTSLVLIFFGSIFAIILLNRLSHRIVVPEIRNAERQKRFITNASHELKTPLSVIRANTEMQEMTQGENEWTKSTLRQVDRMNGLVENLVMISRSVEAENREELSDIDLSRVIRESVSPFYSVAASENKTLSEIITEGIIVRGEES